MNTKLAIGLAVLAGAALPFISKKLTGQWIPGTDDSVLYPHLGIGMSGMYYGMGSPYSPGPYFVPPEYLPNGPGPSRVRQFLPPGSYDPRKFKPFGP